MLQLARDGKFRASWPAILSLALCAGIPIACWMAWCQHNFGDLTGSAAKIAFLGWTHQPFGAGGHHPIFTPPGFWTFISDLIATFWQGEYMWHRQPLAFPLVNVVYVSLSAGLVGLAVANLR